MRSLGWALIQYDWCAYKKRRLGHRQAQKDRVKTPEEDSHQQAKERALEETNPADTLILYF